MAFLVVHIDDSSIPTLVLLVTSKFVVMNSVVVGVAEVAAYAVLVIIALTAVVLSVSALVVVIKRGIIAFVSLVGDVDIEDTFISVIGSIFIVIRDVAFIVVADMVVVGNVVSIKAAADVLEKMFAANDVVETVVIASSAAFAAVALVDRSVDVSVITVIAVVGKLVTVVVVAATIAAVVL